jgi:hypothetical protein
VSPACRLRVAPHPRSEILALPREPLLKYDQVLTSANPFSDPLTRNGYFGQWQTWRLITDRILRADLTHPHDVRTAARAGVRHGRHPEQSRLSWCMARPCSWALSIAWLAPEAKSGLSMMDAEIGGKRVQLLRELKRTY